MQLFGFFQVVGDVEIIYRLPSILASHVEVEYPVMLARSKAVRQQSAFQVGSEVEVGNAL